MLSSNSAGLAADRIPLAFRSSRGHLDCSITKPVDPVECLQCDPNYIGGPHMFGQFDRLFLLHIPLHALRRSAVRL